MAAISPSASKRSSSIAPEKGTNHVGAGSEYSRDRSRTTGGETTTAKEYAGCHCIGGDYCAHRHRQHLKLAEREQNGRTGQHHAHAPISARRPAGDGLRDTATIAGQ